MKNIDDFLQIILNNQKEYESDEFSAKYGYSHAQVLHYLNRIKDLHPEWIKPYEKFLNRDIVFFRFNYEERTYEIKQFLNDGGFNKVDNKEKNKKTFDNWIAIITVLVAMLAAYFGYLAIK